MRLCILWQRFGPYHYSRLAACERLFTARSAQVVGMQVADAGGPHEWDTTGAISLRTLFPGGTVDAIAPRRVRDALGTALDDLAPDAVAAPAYSTPEAQAALVWARKRRKVAVVMAESTREDSSRNRLRERAKHRIVSEFDAALAGGSPQARYIADLGVPKERVFIPYDVVDNAYFATRALKLRSRVVPAPDLPGLSDGRLYFVASGRFIERKNFRRLILAYAAYRKAAGDQSWDLVILGDGSQGRELADLAVAKRLEGSVFFPGYRTLEETSAYYAFAGAFVHPATAEPWGLVINEAMAAGLPILASRRVGAAEDLVSEGVNGFTFDPEDVGGILRALHTVASEDTDRLAMGAKSAERIAHWSPEEFAEGMWMAVQAGAKTCDRRLSLHARLLLLGSQLTPRALLDWRVMER